MLETPTQERGDLERERFIRLMAEALPLAGYQGVHADLPGWDAPELVHGAVRDHRPCIFCEAPCPVYVDVLPLPSRWSLRFGPPIPLGDHGPEAAEDATIVNVLTERVRATLQAMLEEDLAARGSVFL